MSPVNTKVISGKLKFLVFILLNLIPASLLFVNTNLIFPYVSTKHFWVRTFIIITLAAAALPLVAHLNYRNILKSKVFVTYVALLIIFAISNIFAVYPDYAWWGYFERMGGFVSSLFFFLYFALLFIFIDKNKWIYIFRSYFLVSLIVMLMGFLQYKGLGTRADAVFGNPIYLAIFEIFHIGFALLLAAKTQNNIERKLALGSIIPAIILIFLTGTRGAYLALAFGTLVTLAYLAFRKRGNYLKVFAIVSLLLASAWFALQYYKNTDFVQSNYILKRAADISLNSATVQSRLVLSTSVAWPAIKDRPLLGWGQEGFNYVFNKYYDTRLVNHEMWFDRAHNNYVDILVQSGVFALLLYLFLLFYPLYLVVSKKDIFAEEEQYAILFTISAYAFFLLTVFDNISSLVPFSILLAYIAQSELKQQESILNSYQPISRLVILLIVLVITGTILLSQRLWLDIKSNTNIVNLYKLRNLAGKEYLINTTPELKELIEAEGSINTIMYDALSSPTARKEFISIASDPKLLEFVANSNIVNKEDKIMYIELLNRLGSEELKQNYINFRHLYDMVRWLRASGNYVVAEKILKNMLDEAPNRVQFYDALALVYAAQNDFSAAKKTLQKALEIAPQSKQSKKLLESITKAEKLKADKQRMK